MSVYFPMPAYPDMMPVDISFVFEDEKPAGKHGFLKADGEVMRFEDGTLGRFWGVNINGGANFPDKDYAPKFARRLAQAGVNMVRLHQLDAEWDTPNLFAYTKGKRVTDTRHFDPKSMDALDYLIYCLKEEGIYIYLDLMTYRKFKEGDDVPYHTLLWDNAKPWSITNKRLIELQKEFCYNLFHHYNPYTKLQYKDDPVFVMSEINSECDLFVNSSGRYWQYNPVPYYENEVRQMFCRWLQEKGIDYDWQNCDFFTLDAPCEKVQSFGALSHFTKENAPVGAPVRCADGGCPVGDTCPYNCVRHYRDNPTNHRRKNITNGFSASFEPTDEEVMAALKATDFGLCVYQANNDVVDHQTVNMEFAGGATATLQVNAFNEGGRHIRIFGTKGELYAYASGQEITVYTFHDEKRWTVSVPKIDESIKGGHGGGDEGIVRELYEYLSGTYTGYRAADIQTSVKNHLIGFAAEVSRHTNTVVDLNEIYDQYGF